MGVTYYRVVKERKDLRIKLDFYEIRINGSEDRWRAIFMKNQELFDQMVQYIVDKYAHENKNYLFFDSDKIVHDVKLREFFRKVREMQIDFVGDSSRKRLYINYQKEKTMDAYEITFRVYTNRSDPENGSTAIKYQSPNYTKTKFIKEGYSSYEYDWYLLKPNWKVAANKNYPKPEYIRIGDWL